MRVPSPNQDGRRLYDDRPENTRRCIAEVHNPLSWLYAQCVRRRGHGPGGAFCKQHAKLAARCRFFSDHTER